MQGVGRTGTNFNDRVLAGKVRTLALEQIYSILKKGEKHKLFRPVLERLTPNLLPRLNVVSGDAESPLQITISQSAAKKYGLEHESNKATGNNHK